MVAQNTIDVRFIPYFPLLGSNPVFVEFLGNQRGRLDFNEPLKDSLNDPRFFRLNNQLLVFHAVSHRHAAADPFAFLPAGCHLVADPLGDDLTLILREGDNSSEKLLQSRAAP